MLAERRGYQPNGVEMRLHILADDQANGIELSLHDFRVALNINVFFGDLGVPASPRLRVACPQENFNFEDLALKDFPKLQLFVTDLRKFTKEMSVRSLLKSI